MVQAQWQRQSAKVNDIRLTGFGQAPVSRRGRNRLIGLAALFVVRRLTRKELVVWLERPPGKRGKRLFDVADLVLPSVVLGSVQVKRSGIAVAAEIGRAETSDDVAAG